MCAALAVASLVSAGEAKTASAVMLSAQAQAKQEKKHVFVMFHASWCGWCHKLDGFLDDPQMGKLMKDNFVIVHLDVLENADKKDLENGGGEDLMKQWGGANAGLPFTVILDGNGKKLGDSNRMVKDKPANIGYPAVKEEIQHFQTLLRFAPRMTAAQRQQIEKWLTEHAPKT